MTPPSDAPSDVPFIGRRLFLAGSIATPLIAAAPLPLPKSRPRTSVGRDGVWRWTDGREVAVFGVNYDLAAASAFRFAKASGVPFERIAEVDFAHFKRMGFNALRLGFWGDWEATTANGTLVENEHLDVLDMLVARAGEAGFACLLSPIVTYDAAWPDALDRPRTGISHAFKKEVLGTNGAAIAAQARYVGQLLSRINPQTGRRYADEPAIIAIEPINEPAHHSKDLAGSIRYINALAKAVRDTGFTGPVFHNVTQDMGIAPAIAAAEVEGATFAWYPTGLQTGHAVAGNGLLLVENYAHFRDPALSTRAKLVYEFDAADTMASYFYPAMVREFRAGGAQFATMFAYDPMAISGSNSEFNDHYLNLAYTPAKAISAMIAAAAMHDLPRDRDYGRYPANIRFGSVRVDDRADLSELVDATRFYHSNDTDTRPPRVAALNHLAGCGSSPLVGYDGTGAWFLDRVSSGVWRLEVYPDAALTGNPFVFRRPSRATTRIVNRERRMRIKLPDLGESFAIARADGFVVGQANSAAFTVLPGVYRLTMGASDVRVDPTFFAPPGENFAPVLQHEPPATLTENADWKVTLAVISAEAPKAVSIRIRNGDVFVEVPMTVRRGFGYDATIPAKLLKAGYLDYYVTIETADGAGRVAPVNEGSWPGDWDFPKRGGYRVPVVAADAPLVLFDAGRDGDRLIVPYGGYSKFPSIAVTPGDDGSALLTIDGAMLASMAQGDLPAQLAWDGKIDAQGRAIDRFAALSIEGRSTKDREGIAGLILVERDGMAWGAPIAMVPGGGTVRLALDRLKPVDAAMLPRDFPVGINPYWLRRPAGRGGTGDRLRLGDLQAVQIVVGKRFLTTSDDPLPKVAVRRVSLVR